MLSLHTKMKQNSLILCTACTVLYVLDEKVFSDMYSIVKQEKSRAGSL
jgi:hypothetical protein